MEARKGYGVGYDGDWKLRMGDRIGQKKLARKDLNLDFQGQNLTCYHYTTGEC